MLFSGIQSSDDLLAFRKPAPDSFPTLVFGDEHCFPVKRENLLPFLDIVRVYRVAEVKRLVGFGMDDCHAKYRQYSDNRNSRNFHDSPPFPD